MYSKFGWFFEVMASKLSGGWGEFVWAPKWIHMKCSNQRMWTRRKYVNARSGDMCAPMRTIIVVVVIIVSLISRCWYFTHCIIWREKTFSYYQRFERLRWSECLSTEYLERRKSKFRESFEKNNKQKSVEVVNSC